jgi:glycosyltransferase involved in cell wall biosynthesis
MVYWEGLGSRPSTVLFKYIGQAFSTWKVLLREKPDAVFVMSPPVIAALVVFPYCAIRRIPFVVDAHTGAFKDRRWRHFQKLQHWLCRRATTTIITNTHLADLLARQGADSTMLPDVPVKYPPSATRLEKSGFTVAVICSFDYDEPVDVILQAARLLPDVSFYVTGDPRKLERLDLQIPPNLRLTGFLGSAAYGQLLRDADVVMALTTGKHKMLRAAYEAIYEGTPIIISDSPLLREEFDQGGIVVENSPDIIAAAVRNVQDHLDRYRSQARELRSRKERRWHSNKAVLLSKISRKTTSHARV